MAKVMEHNKWWKLHGGRYNKEGYDRLGIHKDSARRKEQDEQAKKDIAYMEWKINIRKELGIKPRKFFKDE
tara:strand:+ start:1000 stop:1212 length:213 start_codon:yes stop_codon:yes gene_type:complete